MIEAHSVTWNCTFISPFYYIHVHLMFVKLFPYAQCFSNIFNIVRGSYGFVFANALRYIHHTMY